MKCENCIACCSYFDGIEEVAYCKIEITEDEAYHDGEWYCNLNRQTIKKRLQDKDLAEVRQMDEREKLLFDFLDSVYGNVEYADGFIYFEDEDTGNRYKVAVYTTN